MKTLFIVARKNRAHLVSIISITAILDLTTVNVTLSNDARGWAQRTATGAHGEVEAVITPGRKTGAEEGFECEVVGLSEHVKRMPREETE
jgi:hypothetical protein